VVRRGIVIHRPEVSKNACILEEKGTAHLQHSMGWETWHIGKKRKNLTWGYSEFLGGEDDRSKLQRDKDVRRKGLKRRLGISRKKKGIWGD